MQIAHMARENEFYAAAFYPPLSKFKNVFQSKFSSFFQYNQAWFQWRGLLNISDTQISRISRANIKNVMWRTFEGFKWFFFQLTYAIWNELFLLTSFVFSCSPSPTSHEICSQLIFSSDFNIFHSSGVYNNYEINFVLDLDKINSLKI